jgi:hypothetical protein
MSECITLPGTVWKEDACGNRLTCMRYGVQHFATVLMITGKIQRFF